MMTILLSAKAFARRGSTRMVNNNFYKGRLFILSPTNAHTHWLILCCDGRVTNAHLFLC